MKFYDWWDRWMVLGVMMIVGALLMGGCPNEKQARQMIAIIAEQAEEIVGLKGDLDEVIAAKTKAEEAMAAGKIPVTEGIALIKTLDLKKDNLATAIAKSENRLERMKELKAEAKASWWEVLGAIIREATIGGGVGTILTRMARGPSSRNFKDPRGRIMDEGRSRTATV